MKTVGKASMNVPWLGNSLPSLFVELEWAGHLARILTSLIRRSWDLLAKDIQVDALKANILTPSEILALYCTRSVVVTPGTRRTKEVTKLKVPSKPKPSAMLLPAERDVINSLAAPLFHLPKQLGKFIVDDANSFPELKAHLTKQMTARADFLAKYAALTT